MDSRWLCILFLVAVVTRMIWSSINLGDGKLQEENGRYMKFIFVLKNISDTCGGTVEIYYLQVSRGSSGSRMLRHRVRVEQVNATFKMCIRERDLSH